jgi:hypothetical protein
MEDKVLGCILPCRGTSCRSCIHEHECDFPVEQSLYKISYQVIREDLATTMPEP